jgi:hypothetical protein
VTPAEGDGWALDDDPWAGMVDERGDLIEIEPADVVAAADFAAGAESPRLFNLPEEFWGSRELFKVIRRQARADGTGPDAVLGAVLARASAMCSHELKFDSGKIGTLNMFVNIVAPTGIGKTEAMRSAQRLVLPPTYLSDLHGDVDFERFKDGVGLGSGEGMAEVFMGMVERDTGETVKYGPNKGEPKTKPVKAQVRHNAFLFLDEGESLNKMLERKGATVGQTIRTAWTGANLGAANAQEQTTRFVPDGSYSIGLLIGWQPRSAQSLIADAAGGTPQRFIWMSGLDPDIPDEPDIRPEQFRLPLCDGAGHAVTGMIEFPPEILRALRLRVVEKMRTGDGGEELHSHEPLMRCKLAALLCVLDGRMLVSADDWRLGGMVWAVSCAVRDRLVAFGVQQRLAAQRAEEERHAMLAAAGETARIEVTEQVLGYAKQIARQAKAAADEFGTVHRSEARRGVKSNLRKTWDAGLAFAVARGWVTLEDDGARIAQGELMP